MDEYRIGFYKQGSHHTVTMFAVSAAQALYKYTKLVPGDRWLWGLFKKGDPSLNITLERKGAEQLALL